MCKTYKSSELLKIPPHEENTAPPPLGPSGISETFYTHSIFKGKLCVKKIKGVDMHGGRMQINTLHISKSKFGSKI